MDMTEESVLATTCPEGKKYAEYTDPSMPGLILRVNSGGARSWAIRVRIPEGKIQVKRNMYDIGCKPNIYRAWKDAQKYIDAYRHGQTPLDAIATSTAPTLNAVFTQYASNLAQHYQTPRGREMAKYNIQCVLDKFGDIPVDNLTSKQFEAWRANEMANGKSAATLNKHLSALRVMITWAVSNNLIASEPLQDVKRLPESKPDVGRALIDDEWKKLIAVLSAPPYRGTYWLPAVILADETGLREGTVFGLVWGDLDFEKRLIRLRPEIMKVKGRGIEWASMTPFLVDTLRTWQSHAPDINPEALVFGVKQQSHNVWAKIKAAAGIHDFRWHDFRHDMASRAVSAGVSDRAVAEMLHQSTTDLVKLYGHLRPDAAIRITEQISRGKKEEDNS